jgi:phosphoribosylformimino-5-aminoimidazole carboxamide ribotide isomerase
MKSFSIIPVIDILNSTAVHAIKGDRINYKPLKSNLFQSSNPIDIIRTLKKKFNFYEFYIADLDSIIKGIPNMHLVKKILEISKIELILDPGIIDLKGVNRFKDLKIKSLIFGLETLKSYKVINQSLEILNPEKIIISIDMYKGQILTSAKDIKNQTPIDIVNKIESLGIKSIILLDLYRVGQKIGGIPPHYLEILNNFSGDIFVGGGIKNIEDILNYKNQNFSGILIATALYDGTITAEKLRNLK